jgi:hypothetical protein
MKKNNLRSVDLTPKEDKSLKPSLIGIGFILGFVFLLNYRYYKGTL